MAEDPYVYPRTDTLRNRLGIREATDLAAVHPFREGNGRTQRAFLGQIAKTASHPIAWARLGAERNVHAAQESHRGDNLPLCKMLSALLL